MLINFKYKSASALIINREFSRLKKEPSRVVGMLVQPLVFLLVFGLGFDQSFRSQSYENMRYSAFFYPGILALVLLFAAIYATLTLVDDKKCGFFRLLLVSPLGVSGALWAKVAATALLGFLQSLLFLPLAFSFALKLEIRAFFIVLFLLLLGSICFALLGVIFAWLSPSPSAFHALMSVILIPMWLLSGAMFPLDNIFLKNLSFINPVSYLVTALRRVLFEQQPWWGQSLALILFCLALSFLLTLAIKKRPLE